MELGGTIEVSSEEGSYTSFVATLPVVQSTSSAIASGHLKLNKHEAKATEEVQRILVDAEGTKDWDLQVCNTEEVQDLP